MAEINDIREFREKQKKKERKVFFLRLGICAAAAVLIGAFLLLYEPIFGVSLAESIGLVEAPKGYPVEITGGTPKMIHTLGTRVSLLTDTEVMVYDEYGTLSLRQVHNCTNPRMKTQGDCAVVYDVGYYAYTVIGGDTLIKSGDCENQIIGAAVGKNGNYALITASTKFLTELKAVNRKGETVAAWKSTGNYIHAAAFSPDGQYLAASALYSDNGLAKTTVRILDLKNEENPVVADREFPNSSLIAMTYLDNGNLCLVFDRETVVTDAVGEVLLRYPYAHELYYYNLNEYGAFLAEKNGEEVTAHLVYDAKNVSPSVTLPENFKAEQHKKAEVYLLGNDTLTTYDRQFTPLSEEKDLTEAFGIACNEIDTYLLTFTQIEKLKQEKVNAIG